MAVPASLERHLQFKNTEEFLRGRYSALVELMRARNAQEMIKLPGNAVEKKWGAKGLDQVFKDLQTALQSLVSALNDSTTVGSQTHAKPLIWAQEKQRLQHFYAYLKSSPAAFNLCESLCSAADSRIPFLISEEEKAGLILKTREQIGKIVFLFDEDPKAFDSINKDTNSAISEIETQVKILLMGSYDKLFGSCERAEQMQLQMKGDVLRNEKLKIIARCLINSQGQLNFGLIPFIKIYFFPTVPKEPYVDNLFFALDSMDSYWQEYLESIKLPLKTYVNDVIAADQGLKSDQLTARVVRQEVLYAVLSQLGGSVNAFTGSWAIKKPQEFVKRMFEDYRCLLQEGCLIRMESGAPERFFFKKTNADKSGNILKLGEDGLVLEYTNHKNETVSQSDLFFYECPHLVNAAKMMGIDLCARKNDFLKLLFPSPLDPSSQTSKIYTWGELIEVIASLPPLPSDKFEERKYLGRYAFSLSTCRLLQARESALAVMWENRMSDCIRKKVESTIMGVFKETFDRYQCGVPVYQKVIVEELKRIFAQTIQKSSYFVYNASSGSFDLYQRNVANLNKRGIRVATPEEFRRFAFEAIEETGRFALEKAKDSFRDRGAIQAVIEGMKAAARAPDFMSTILEAHDSMNIKTSDFLANYSKLVRTPMSHKPERSFLELDPGVEFIPDTRTVLPRDPRAMLKWMLDLARWKIAVGALQHRPSIRQMFNIELLNEEFQNFIKGNLHADVWIDEMLMKPGHAVSESIMEEQTKILFQQNLEVFTARIFHEIPVPVLRELDELFKLLSKQRMTVNQYCRRMSDGLISIFCMDDQQMHILSFVLDSILFEHLPPQQKNVILNGAVRFAKYMPTPEEVKTRELKDEYFCFYFSPITQQIRLGILSKDRKVLQPMDEYTWWDPSTWHAYPDPINEKVRKLIEGK